jgi:hypothetical protein
VLPVAGVAVGGAAAAALMHFDGTTPIDVSRLLGTLVGIQLLILAGLLWELRPKGRSPRRPGAVQTALASIIVGRAATRGGGARLFDGGFGTPAGEVLRWRLVALSQSFGVGFNLGALALILAMVSFTDLAFSWSTTLQLDPTAIEHLTHALSLPFAWAWPDARPTPALIAATQLFRAAPHAVAPEVAGGWWPFVTACLATYGLLPRLTLLAVAAWTWRLKLRRALDAANRRDLGRGMASADAGGAKSGATTTPWAAKGQSPAGGPCGIVLWRDVPVQDQAATGYVAQALPFTPAWVLRAGGTALDLDGGNAARRAASQGVAAMVVVVEQHEHLDKALQRFLAGLRRAKGLEKMPVVLLPVLLGDGSALAAPDDLRRLEVWEKTVAALPDRSVWLAGGERP